MAGLAEILGSIDQRLAAIAAKPLPAPATRSPDRAVLPGAHKSLVEHVAKGNAIGPDGGPTDVTIAQPPSAKNLRSNRVGLAGAMQKALALGTEAAGGYLVAEEVADDVMRQLRARSVVMRMQPRIIGVQKELAVTSLASAATAYYVPENAHIAPSEPTFAEAPLLRPRELAALVPVSNRLLRAAAEEPGIEEVLRSDLAEILALRADLAFLQGTGGIEPLGIRNTPGLTAGPPMGTDGRAPTFDDLKLVVANLRSANAPFLHPGWIFHPRTLSSIERLKTANGDYLGDTGLLEMDATGGGGTLLGYPFQTTTQIPTNLPLGTSNDSSYLVFSSDWEEAWVGEEQSLTIELSGEATYTPDGGTTWISAFQARQHLMRATATHDFALRRPQLFTVLHGLRPLSD
jgi:HK97 family phage major capsid protein